MEGNLAGIKCYCVEQMEALMKRGIITVVCICSCLADYKNIIYIHIKMKLEVEERIFSLRTLRIQYISVTR